MCVLILSTSNNPHGDAVSKALISKGAQVIRADFDKVSIDPPCVSVGTGMDQAIDFVHESIPTRSITGVFLHHPRLGIGDNAGVDSIDRKLWEFGWVNAIDWLEGCLQDAKWINRPSRCRFALSTSRQLQIAAGVGLSVPPTLYTNSLEKLRQFAILNGVVVLKSGPVPGAVPDQHRLLASIVDPAAIMESELASSPCLFQQYIEKKYELRVHVIGTQVLTCRIDSQANERTKVDWRNYDIANTPHTPFELDPEVQKCCIQVVSMLGLQMGIIDLIVTPDGRVVFLECNAQGSWHWIQQLTGLKITEAVVQQLI